MPLNWSQWDTLLIVAGIACLIIAAVFWKRAGQLTRIIGCIAGAMLVGAGLITGFMLEAVYPLILYFVPLAILAVALFEQHQVSVAAAKAASAAGPAPGGGAPAWQPSSPMAGQPARAGADAYGGWDEDADSAPQPADARGNRMRPAFSLDDDEITADRAARERAARASDPNRGPVQPQASNEEIDAALAEWYFEPFDEEAEPDEASSGHAAAPAAPAAPTPAAEEPDDDERLLAGGPVGDLDAPSADGPRTLDEVRDAPATPGAPADAPKTMEPGDATAAAGPAPAPAPAPAPGPVHGFTAAQAADPSTDPATLHRIAAEAPELHASLAGNPALYPTLVDWLATSPDPEVQRALAARRA